MQSVKKGKYTNESSKPVLVVVASVLVTSAVVAPVLGVVASVLPVVAVATSKLKGDARLGIMIKVGVQVTDT